MELRFNMKMFVICLYPLCCLLLMSSVHDVAGQCTMRGRFGANCRYQCHCELGSDDCNRTTGVCSIGQACASGYYGNNCQNQNVALKKPAYQSSIYAALNDLSYVSYSANFAVDGISSTNFDSNSCAHTQERIHSWWYVDLGREYNIRYLRVYNREGFQWRLQGFEVRIGNYIAQHASFLLCYRHPNTTPSLVIDVACNSVMRGRYVRINLGSSRTALTLCEVQVFVCTLYSFGANCMQTCNCKLANDVCNTVTGNCSSGCAAGFQGEDCKAACDNNRYGDSCASPCNANCILSSGSRTCHHLTGHCSNGCQSGYQGGFCNTECGNNKYGDRCATTCNANCRSSSRGKKCHHVTGSCSYGCQPGYQGSFCNTECDSGTYGLNCKGVCNENCQPTENEAPVCHHVTGTCTSGCQDGYILNSESMCTMSLTLAPRNAEHDSLFDGGTIAGIVIGCLLGVALVAALIAAIVIIYKQRRKFSKATAMQVSHVPDQHTYQDLIPHPQEAAEHVAETVIEFETSPDVEGVEYCEISEIIATDSQHEAHVNGKNESGVYLTPHTYSNADQGP